MGWSNATFQLLIITASPSGFSGLFVYSPAPGPVNLIASVTASAGTDPFGNAYQAGITSYSSGTTYTQIHSGLLDFVFGAIKWRIQDNASNQLVISDIVNNRSLFVENTGPSVTVVPNDPNNVNNPEIWHDSTSLLNAGWAANDAGGTIATMKYTLSGADNKVLLQGTLHQTSATPSAILLTLPTGYRPATSQFVPVLNFNGVSAPGAIVQINPTGDVLAPLPLPGNGNDVIFDVFYRLVA